MAIRESLKLMCRSSDLRLFIVQCNVSTSIAFLLPCVSCVSVVDYCFVGGRREISSHRHALASVPRW